MLAGDLELPHQLPGMAGLAEPVLDPDHAERNRVTVEFGRLTCSAALTQLASPPTWCSSAVTMIPVSSAGPHHRLRVQRLQGVHVDDPGLKAEVLLEHPGRAHRLGHHRAAGDDGQVLVLALVVRCELGLERVDEVLLLAPVAGMTLALPNTNGVLRSVTIGVASRAKRMILRALELKQQVFGGLLGLNRVARDRARACWAGRKSGTGLPAPGGSRRPGRPRRRRARRQSGR